MGIPKDFDVGKREEKKSLIVRTLADIHNFPRFEYIRTSSHCSLVMNQELKSKYQDIKFQVKLIHWSDYEHESPILLQDINGPCPLIALVNTLILKYEIKYRNYQINSDFTNPDKKEEDDQLRIFESIGNLKKYLMNNVDGSASMDKLLSQLGDVLLVFNDIDDIDDKEGESLDKLLESLPLLHTGLTVNPNLVTGDFPSNELASILFKKFHLTFKHGWILDQVNDEKFDGNYGKLVDILNDLQTFDKIQDYLLSEDSNKYLVEKWLELNKTQLTKNGLKKLNLNLNTDNFIIFFRNNHFVTLYKRSDNDFYILVTDAIFNNKSSNKKIVWQSLISVSGIDDLFFTGDFIPSFGDDTFDVMNDENDESYKLIKKLQEEEDQRMAQELQAKLNHKKTIESKTIENDKNKKKLSKKHSFTGRIKDRPKDKPKDKLKDKPKSKSKDKNGQCIIV